MTATRHDMRDVALGDGGEAEVPADGPAGRPGGRWGRVPRRWPVGAVLLVLLVAGVVDARGRQPDADAAVPVPGALAPVDGPLRELWRVPGLSMLTLELVDELVVGAGRRPDGAIVAVGLVRVSGEAAWEVPLSPGGRNTGGASCTTPGGEARVTVCVVVDAVGPVVGFSPSGLTEPTAARLVVLDAVTGRVQREVGVEPSTAVASLGDDLVITHVDDAGHLHARRTDPLAQGVRWSFRSPERLEGAEFGRWAWVTTRHGVVLAGNDAGWVLSAEGEALDRWHRSPRGIGWLDVLRSGLVVHPSRDGGRTSAVVDPPTSTRVRLEGRALAPVVDDGSAGDLVLVRTSDDRLTAVDGRTGRPAWSAPDGGTGAPGLLVAAGLVVRTTDDGLSALDARTGEQRWSTSLVPATRYPLMTDGRLVLCVEQDADRGPVLGAYGLSDGRLRWAVELPGDADNVAVVGGELFAQLPGGLVALG